MGLFIRRCKGIALYVYHHVSGGIDKAAGRRDNKPKNVDYLLYNDDSVLYYHVYFQYEVMDNHFLRRSLYSEKRQK